MLNKFLLSSVAKQYKYDNRVISARWQTKLKFKDATNGFVSIRSNLFHERPVALHEHFVLLAATKRDKTSAANDNEKSASQA